MSDTRITGVRFVQSNFADRSRASETASWYDRYAHRLDDIGQLVDSQRFENRSAERTDSDPEVLAVYDIVVDDPADAWPATEASDRYPHDLFADEVAQLVKPAIRGSYALVGQRGVQFRSVGARTALVVLLSSGGDDPARASFEAELYETGLFSGIARFRLIEGSPQPAPWLELLSTVDSEPQTVWARAKERVTTPDAIDFRPAATFFPVPSTVG